MTGFTVTSSHNFITLILCEIQEIPSRGVLNFFYLVINVFHRETYSFSCEAIGLGPNCVSRGVCTSISKETYSNL